MKKINKKKACIVCFSLIIIFLAITIMITNKGKNNASTNIKLDDSEIEEISNIKEEGYTVKKIENKFYNTQKIKIESISIRTIDDEIDVVTKIKNKDTKDLDGFNLDIDLLDTSGNVVTSISQNSEQVLKKNQSLEFLNYAVGIENAEKIVRAKVNSIERGTIEYNVEKSLEQ